MSGSSLPRHSTGLGCSKCPSKKACWATIFLWMGITSLTVALIWNTISQTKAQGEQDADIDALEAWKRSVERQVDWMRLDHDRWADQLQRKNPGIEVPQTTLGESDGASE